MARTNPGLLPTFVDQNQISPLLSSEENNEVVQDASEVQTLLINTQTKQVKEIIRTNHWAINHPVRRQLWEVICNQISSSRHESLYKDMLLELFGEHNHPNCLPPFADPAYCTRYYLNAEGRKSVERMLHVIHHLRPDITYCPMLYPIISLFLHYMPEDVTFSCVYNLLSEKQSFISQTKSAHQVSAHLVMKLSKRFSKSSYTQLEKELQEQENLERVFQNWLLWIFKGLPLPYLVRVIDCFLLDKKKVLYRIVLAILILFNKHSTKTDQNMEASVMQRLPEFCQSIPVPIERLFKVAYGIRGFSEKLLGQLLVKAEITVKSRSFSGDRALSEEKLPSSDSAYHLQITSGSIPIIRELKLNSKDRARSLGVIPLGKFSSEIIAPEQMTQIWSWLPLQVTMNQPEVVYSTNNHGACLTAFYMTVGTFEPTVIVIKATNDEVFGAYCSNSWNSRKSSDTAGKQHLYFGTGETFLFTIFPETKKYPWIGLKDAEDVPHSAKLFMAADNTMITVGAGNGQGLMLDEQLLHGRTEHCDTFDNSPLCSSSDFECKVVEIIAFK